MSDDVRYVVRESSGYRENVNIRAQPYREVLVLDTWHGFRVCWSRVTERNVLVEGRFVGALTQAESLRREARKVALDLNLEHEAALL